MKICPKCNTVYTDENGFCQKCGVALIDKVEQVAPAPVVEEKRFCSHCGALITTSTRFCPQCGQPTTGETINNAAQQINNVVPQMRNPAMNVQSETQARGMIAAFKCAMIEKFATARGRASRSEYWYSVLVNLFVLLAWYFVVIIGTVGTIASDSIEAMIAGMGFLSIVSLLITIIFTIPGTCLSIRRLHDTNHSGWWVFINIVPFLGQIYFLYLCVKESEPADNIYGSYPPRYF